MKAVKNVFVVSVIIQGFIWIVFCCLNITPDANFILPILMVANGIGFFLSALLFDRNKFFKILVYAFLFINLILTLTDETGFYDYLVLVLNVISMTSLIAYLLFKRKQINY